MIHDRYALSKKFGGEAGVRAAYTDNPLTMKGLIEREIASFDPDVLARDWVSREYVGMLRRVLGDAGADPHAEHKKQMEAALAALKK